MTEHARRRFLALWFALTLLKLLANFTSDGNCVYARYGKHAPPSHDLEVKRAYDAESFVPLAIVLLFSTIRWEA